MAPPASARARKCSSGKAVMKTVGIAQPAACSRRCKSRPLMPGIWMSVTIQEVSAMSRESKKDSADSNVCAVNPSDRTKLPSAALTEASSSMIEMTGFRANPTVLRHAGMN